MSDETCPWREWRTSVEWSPDIAPDMRERLGAFLDVALVSLETLVARCDRANGVEVIGALSPYLCRLDPEDGVNELLNDVHEQALAAANEAHVLAWTEIVADVFE